MDTIIHWIFENGVSYVLYFLLTVVVLKTTKTIIEDSVRGKVMEMGYRYRLRKKRASRSFHEKQYIHPFFKHLYFLIKTTAKEKKELNILSFVIVTSLLIVFSFVFWMIAFHDLFFGVLISLLIGLIPYMVLHVRLLRIRHLLSEDFINISRTIAQNYNAAQYDMYHALIETSKGIENKRLRRVIIHLISDLQVARNEEEIRLAIEIFVYTAGTNWAKRLGNIIMKGYLYGENVMNTLLNLIRQLEETEEMLEEEKSHTLDTVWNGYLTIPLFIASLVLGYYVSGAQDWFVLQFGQYWTRLLFVVCVVLIVFSNIISMILRNPKNDI